MLQNALTVIIVADLFRRRRFHFPFTEANQTSYQPTNRTKPKSKGGQLKQKLGK